MPKFFSPPNILDYTSPVGLPRGRLTLTTAVPVLTTAVSASANVLYTPYVGNKIPIWNGAVFQDRTFTELTNVLANTTGGQGGPAAGAASKNYDLFVCDIGGTLCLIRGGAWNTDLVRSSTTENDLTMVQGILVNLNAITNGPAALFGTYVGTIRTDSGGATVTFQPGASGSPPTAANIGLWNMYNRVLTGFKVTDTTASWLYTSATAQSKNASNNNRVSFIRGLNHETIHVVNECLQQNPAAAGSIANVGLALDATNAINAGVPGRVQSETATVTQSSAIANYDEFPGLGFHFLQATESGDGTHQITFVSSGFSTLTGQMMF